jgi:hypothetical protein
MTHADEFARCLVTCDVPGMRRLWRHVSPHLSQPANDHETLIAIHHARTQADSFSLRLRAYSHAWLVDHGYPSGLPDELRPAAQRMYPVIQHAVGIAVRSKYPEVQTTVMNAMSGAVLEAEADGRLTDSPFVKRRMMEERGFAIRKLFGR